MPWFDHARSRFQTLPSQAVRKTGSRTSASGKGWGDEVRHRVEIAGMVDISGPIEVRIDGYSFHNTAAKLEAPVQNTDRPTCASASQRAECPDT